MADHQEEDDLQMALRLSMQNSPPEPKRSKPFESPAVAMEVSPDTTNNRMLQREVMAAAAEKRMLGVEKKKAIPSAFVSASASASASASGSSQTKVDARIGDSCKEEKEQKVVDVKSLSLEEACQLFYMVFGSDVSKNVLVQWSNQGIRFSPDPETSMGLVQHEGGPCGVLATIQAFFLKYLLFIPEELGNLPPNMVQSIGRAVPSRQIASPNFSSLTEEAKTRALVRSMSEILFLCGSYKGAVVATLSAVGNEFDGSETSLKDEMMSKERLPIESGGDLQKVLRVVTYTTHADVVKGLTAMLPVYQSRMGALLFLISALLSRGLDTVQADRDDPSLPLVTAPFGHASQEIVNLLLCGQAVANVFDGRMDLGGGMFLNGISTSVEVGFLTLLESLNFCKVGQNLKCPKWPIWVVGSESHYTVLFALDTHVQEENKLEERESQIRRAFDAQDQSGGGGFISVEGLRQVLQEANIRLPPEKFDSLSSSEFVVWSEFWLVILDLDKNLGGLKDSTGLMGKKVFDIFHFNGIAKSDLNYSQVNSGGQIPAQKPRLTKLIVSVPPRWTQEEYMADVATSSSGFDNSRGKDIEVNKPVVSQHAPLVDCIRTRWPRATCSWMGDPPSIV